jgi:hypothetical protein
MKTLIGIILIFAGIALGLYVGVWLMFIGGVVQVIEAIKATPVEAMGIAVGALRVLAAGVVGVLTAIIAIFPGYAMVTK